MALKDLGMVYNKDLVKPEDVADYESFVRTLEKFKAEGINGFGLSKEAYFLIGHIVTILSHCKRIITSLSIN